MESATAGAVDTRARLLEAAGQVFAEKGFRAATVKEICDAAGANIAAVNYHFGDKERLYVATLRYAHGSVVNVNDLRREWPPGSPPEHKLGQFIHTVLRGMLAAGKPAWHGRIMAREMIEPTAALDELVEQEIRPKSQLLRQIISEITGLPPHDERTVLNAMSVIGQCLFFHQGRPVIARMSPGLDYSDEHTIERIADHVTDFTLRSLSRVKRAPAGAPQRRRPGGRRTR